MMRFLLIGACYIFLCTGCGFVSTIASNAWAFPMKIFSAPVGLVVNGEVSAMRPNHYFITYDQDTGYEYGPEETLLYELVGIPAIPFSFFMDSFDAFERWGVLRDFGIKDHEPEKLDFYGRQHIPEMIKKD